MTTNHANHAIGKSTRRVDAVGKVTGETLYPGDLVRDDMLHMKILFAGRPHGRILSIDTSKAEQAPGVQAILTARDVPVNEYGLVEHDQPVLCGPGSDKKGADVVRFVGDQVALVIADKEEQASHAIGLIDVQYEDLPVIASLEEAMAEGAYQIHHDLPGNLAASLRMRKGDMQAAWDKADVIVEGTYHTGWQEHAFLQPEAGLAYIDEEGRVTVEVAGQWAHEDQLQICHALDLPEEEVRVIYPAIGGAFGGREDMSIQVVLALAALRVRRPVKIVWSREESIIGHHKRHPFTIKTRWGATRDGKVIAAECEVIGDSGAYTYTSSEVLGNIHLMVTGPYEIDNVKVDSYVYATNNLPSGAFRGFGGPQGSFAAEGQISKLAEALDMDPVEIRMKNVLTEGSLMSVNTPVPKGVTIQQVIERCAEESGWQHTNEGWRFKKAMEQPTNPMKRRGIGFACSFKNIGYSFGFPEQAWATIELHGDAQIEEVILRHAGADVGQGAHTVFAQMAAEATGIPIEKVRLDMSDTASSKSSGSASASRLTYMSGNAIIGAAEEALKAWQDEERPAISTYRYVPPATTPYDSETGEGEPMFAIGYVAQTIEVEVDLETGQIDLLKVTTANDVGRAINPQLVHGQIEGAIVQGQGYAIMEHFQMQDGYVQTPFLSNYLIPTVLDVPPEVNSIIMEIAEPNGPWGVRGMAEMPLMTVAPAVAAAVHNATGVWLDSIPLTPDKVVARLRQAGLGSD